MRCHIPQRVHLLGLDPSHEPYSGFDHIQEMVFSSTQRNPVIQVPVSMIKKNKQTSLAIYDYCIMFVHAALIFIVYNTNGRNVKI